MQKELFIVCGWFTPDYRHWWERLRTNLEEIGAPYDFVECPKSEGGWERNTMRKPREVLAAINRHPDKAIIFLDVDCMIPGGYGGLSALAQISGDVAFYVYTKWSKRSARPILRVRSGTLVIRPTGKARAFVEAWHDAGKGAHRYAVDQDSMIVAMGRVPGLSITHLDNRYCVSPPDDCAKPVILHSNASRGAHTSKWAVRLYRIVRSVLPSSTTEA